LCECVSVRTRAVCLVYACDVLRVLCFGVCVCAFLCAFCVSMLTFPFLCVRRQRRNSRQLLEQSLPRKAVKLKAQPQLHTILERRINPHPPTHPPTQATEESPPFVYSDPCALGLLPSPLRSCSVNTSSSTFKITKKRVRLISTHTTRPQDHGRVVCMLRTKRGSFLSNVECPVSVFLLRIKSENWHWHYWYWHLASS
jgi:hypothetical protein